MTVNLTDPIYQDANLAREHLEKLQWPEGPVCPHCGNVDGDRITKLKGKSTRPGVYKCNECRKPFSVTVGTVFERSKIPLNKWLLAVHLMSASKKGISAHQLWRMLGFGSYRTAWFMAHRIREAMRDNDPGPMGGEGQTIEADETYIGNARKSRQRDVLLPDGKGWAKRGGVTGKITGGTTELYLALSTPGGQVMAGLTAFNILKALPAKLITHNVGNIDSIGNAIFLAGEERYACEHSTFMFHGVGLDFANVRLEEKGLREALDGILADQRRIGDIIQSHSTLDTDETGQLFREARTKDANAAKEIGIVHSVEEFSIPAGAAVVSLVLGG